ncbi:MAG: ABC transporter ATP-binding protein [Lachnospiraceae bacterium]|nr:ABC transporter ATP-binding protein [Lachnospiraceae bacterium]
MLKLRNIYKTFNAGTINEKRALNDINLVLNDGDFVTVIGGNGAGKSTLQNVISGSIIPDFGNIEINGLDITKLPEHKRAKYIGRVFQDPMLGTASDMWIEENLALAIKRGENRSAFKWMINSKNTTFFREQLEKLGLGLENRMKTKVKLLSGGQRQALTLLMSTLKKPDLLMLDEHTAALDPKTASLVLSLTDEIINKSNITTIMITHNMRDALNYGNRLIMMDQGSIIFDVKGDEKKKLTVEDLLKKFNQTKDAPSDAMILG